MSQAEFRADNPYASFGNTFAIDAPATERLAFIKRTYLHLAMAVYAVVVLEWAMFTFIPGEVVVRLISLPYAMLVMFGSFMLVSFLAERWARSSTSLAVQYLGLGAYVVAWSVFLFPMLWFAQTFALKMDVAGTQLGVVPAAGLATAVIFALMTIIVFATRKDFSFLGPALAIAGFVALGLILLGAFGLLQLGPLFSIVMIGFAACYILYDTSNVLHHYRTEQHVAASLALFASVALLFWYILQLFIALSGRD